ncbi:MAG: hypothetical protein EZS28_004389 [Streblomastix strix]|uniref:Uncharacterized protein n=1 Tax=Streblomastix strix TaxID=222440 RepID=A0A5J4X0F9_9EUKA|nr:MAG: hypothetical protein EZS28_004389 [Streblomastix strix]
MDICFSFLDPALVLMPCEHLADTSHVIGILYAFFLSFYSNVKQLREQKLVLALRLYKDLSGKQMDFYKLVLLAVSQSFISYVHYFVSKSLGHGNGVG